MRKSRKDVIAIASVIAPFISRATDLLALLSSLDRIPFLILFSNPVLLVLLSDSLLSLVCVLILLAVPALIEVVRST